MIAIVNYGLGNIQAIGDIFHRFNIPFIVASDPAELEAAGKILLPGVGAFDSAMRQLNHSGMRSALENCVLKAEKPLLGICVGMQLLAGRSEEGTLPGLGWIEGTVRKLDQSKVRLPHMGWNTVEWERKDPLFEGVDLERGFYFLHSYHFSCDRRSDELATTDYGGTFSSVVNRRNIYGVQFHPEKSHNAGVQLLKNFAMLASASGSVGEVP